MTRCPVQVDVGAYLLDALEPDERERMERHLRTCPACSADLGDLAGLPTRLASVPAADVVGAGLPSRLALRGPPGGRVRRRRARAPTLAAVLLGVAVAGGAAVRPSDRPPEPSLRSATSGAVQATAALTATRNGTRVVLTLAGVPAHEQCRLVAVGRHGQRQTAGTWTATRDGDASVTGWLGLDPADVDRLVVERHDGAALVVLPSPQP